MTPNQAKRFLEVSYLVLEHDVTPAADRPPRARQLIGRWRRELARLTRLAEAEALQAELARRCPAGACAKPGCVLDARHVGVDHRIVTGSP